MFLLAIIGLSAFATTQPQTERIRRLTDAEIRKTLVGRTTLFPPARARAKLRTREYFWAGGRYTGPAGAVAVESTYRVDRGRICVGSGDQACRQIGRDGGGRTYFVFGGDLVEFEARPIE